MRLRPTQTHCVGTAPPHPPIHARARKAGKARRLFPPSAPGGGGRWDGVRTLRELGAPLPKTSSEYLLTLRWEPFWRIEMFRGRLGR